jgi:hypothetical protein
VSSLSKSKLVEVFLAVGLALLLLSTAGCIDVEYSSSGRIRTQMPTFKTTYADVEQPVIVPVEKYVVKDNTINDGTPETRFAKFTGGR